MKNALKLSLVLGSLSILYLILGVVNYFYALPAFYAYSIVGGILTLLFFSILLQNAASSSPLKWPLISLVGMGVLSLVNNGLVTAINLKPVVDEQSYQAYLELFKWYNVIYVLSMVLTAIGYVWFGLFFKKGSVVQISAFLIPVILIAGFIWAKLNLALFTDYSDIIEKEQIRRLSVVVIFNTCRTIFYYSFYKYNQSYGRN
jgi:hypothetical protein